MPKFDEKNKIDKRGRKAIKMTIILSQFLNRTRTETPRKEYLRCCLFRKMFKMIKSIIKNKAKIILHPSYANFCILIKSYPDTITQKIMREKLPFVENKKNKYFKSYNNAFCKKFFQDRLMKTIFEVFLEVLFSSYEFKELQTTIGIYCCQGECADENSCRLRYDDLKQVILEDFLR